MFDIMIKVLVHATWAGLIITPISLFGLRLYYFLTAKMLMKNRLFILLLPFAIGVELFVPVSKFKKIYRIMTICCFGLLLLTSLFLIYQYKTN